MARLVKKTDFFSALLFALLCSIALNAFLTPSSFAEEVLILTDEIKEYPLNNYLEILEDKTGSLSVKDILRPESDSRFVKNSNKVPNFGYTNSTIWVRVKIKNHSIDNTRWILEQGFTNMHYINFYIFSESGEMIKNVHTGILKPVTTRDIHHHKFIFQIPVENMEERILFLRFKSETSITLPLTIIQHDEFHKKDSLELTLFGVLYGIILVMLVFNFILYFFLKTKSHLYFCIINLIIFITSITYEGFGPYLLWPAYERANIIILPLVLWFGGIFSIKLTTSFLQTAQRTPVFHKLFNIILIMWLPLIMVPLMSYSAGIICIQLLGVILFIIILIAAFIRYFRGANYARLMIIGIMFPLLTMIITIFVRLGFIQSNLLTENIIIIGVIWFITSWPLVLVYRLNNLKNKEKKAYASLIKERTLKEKLFNTSPVFIVAFDPNGIVLMLNDTIRNKSGYSFDEIQAPESFSPHTEKSNINGIIDIFKALADSKDSSVYENHLFTKDGSELIVEWHPSKILNSSGQLDLLFAMGIDITEKKKAEARVFHSQKMESIGRLAGGIAHDFNNILTSILGYSQLIQLKTENDEKLTRYASQVIAASYRAQELIQQILTFSRQSESEKKPINIGIIVKEALNLLRASLPATITIQEDILIRAGTVLADSTQIHQLVMNLCTNAFHAMEENGGILAVALDKREFSVNDTNFYQGIEAGKYLKLSVSDTGHGMDKEMITRIFEPFFTTKEVGKGTGIGLSTVHGIIEEHGGTIIVNSQPGLGTSFHVFFPVMSEETMEQSGPENYIPSGHENILFLDDEENIAEMGGQMLKECGYTIVSMTNPYDALKAFQATPDKYDIVVTDMTMPDMTGDKFAKKLMEIRPDIPVIICTGFSSLTTKEKSLKMGIKAFLKKPLTIFELASTVRNVLDEQKKKDSE